MRDRIVPGASSKLSGRDFQQPNDQRQKLFLAADNSVELIDILIDLRILERLPRLLLRRQKEEASVADDVGDEQTAEIEIATPTQFHE